MAQKHSNIRFVVVIIVLILVVVSFVTAITTIKIPYEETITYTDREPYITQETYYENEIKINQVPLSYTVLNYWISSDRQCGFLWLTCETWYYLNVKVKNTDREGGPFTVDYTITKSNGETVRESSTQYIVPFEEKTFRAGGYKFVINSWQHEVDPSTKDVTTTERVPRQRDVTRYRDVERTRKEIKYHTILQSWLGKE